MKEFNCKCSGDIKVINSDKVKHACELKNAHLTSYYDGIPKYAIYERTKVNPTLTNGEERYNWYLAWD